MAGQDNNDIARAVFFEVMAKGGYLSGSDMVLLRTSCKDLHRDLSFQFIAEKLVKAAVDETINLVRFDCLPRTYFETDTITAWKVGVLPNGELRAESNTPPLHTESSTPGPRS